MPGAKKCFSLLSIPFVLAILFATLLIWLVHLTCLFIIMPRKLKSVIGNVHSEFYIGDFSLLTVKHHRFCFFSWFIQF